MPDENAKLAQTAADLEQGTLVLKEENARLQGSVKDLDAVNKSFAQNQNKLNDEVSKLEDVKTMLAKYATDSGDNLSAALENVSAQFSKLDGITKHYERLMVEKVAQDLEFMDASEGMSKSEWTRFVARVPKRIAKVIKDKGTKFNDICGDDNSISYDQLMDYIDSIWPHTIEKQVNYRYRATGNYQQ